MKPYFVKTPKIVQKFFPNYIWQVGTQKKEIYLTFDDGPHPEITPWVLDLLKKYKATATFFCVGDNIKKYPEIFEQLIQQEHGIGNHTFNHLNGWKTNNKLYFNNIDQADKIIWGKNREKTIEIKTQQPTTSNQHPTTNLFRPPYGKIKSSQSKYLLKQGYQIIMWDVLSGDFDKKTSKKKCLQNVLSHATNGSIIVFHDSEKAFKNLEYTLPKVMEYFSGKGFAFKRL